MPSETNVMLSPKELELVSNADWLFAKQEITQKVYRLFGNLVEAIDSDFLVDDIRRKYSIHPGMPKISKGENYLGLPWVLLDHPRVFEKENIFALRTMFWWGNFFSVCLQLSGTFKKVFIENYFEKTGSIENDFFICVNEDPWQHHFGPDNFVPVISLDKVELEKIIIESPFLKLAVKHEFNKWEVMEKLLSIDYVRIERLIS